MRESTEIKLIKAAKYALKKAGLREITTERQEKMVPQLGVVISQVMSFLSM